jgi:hypothetical protein
MQNRQTMVENLILMIFFLNVG